MIDKWGVSMKANVFGDVRAEHDHEMLDSTFLENQDYKTIFADPDRFVVVGRRGTGKSALTYRLQKDWKERRSPVIIVAPEEEHVLGLRPAASLFGSTVSRIRAGIKIAWRYAMLMEIASALQKNYKFRKIIDANIVLSSHVKKWISQDGTSIERVRSLIREATRGIENEEDRIADLASALQINRVTEEMVKAVLAIDHPVVLLIDRLDEGYEPDQIGVGIVDGIIYGTEDLRSTLGRAIRPLIFVRDNILRAIQTEDKDFSRNLEASILRLHWDPQELFYLVARRIRSALDVDKESDVKVWNAVTANELHGREGFKRCLKLTLYRPRDLIALMNAAYYQTRRQGRDTLIGDDFKASARQISATRFDDLSKEYEAVFPGIREYSEKFSGGPPKFAFDDAIGKVAGVVRDGKLNQAALQHYEILGSDGEVVKALYGVGFLGIYDKDHGTFVFSHDGKEPNRTLGSGDTLMVHPCYWLALNIGGELEEHEAEEIFDEYEVRVTSYGSEQRKHNLGTLISELNQIPTGSDGAEQFEDWCKRTIEIAFATQLVNVQLKPNGNATLRRDIVATNHAQSGFWARVLQDYSTRQVVFEVKNYERIAVDEYRQAASYLGKEYGKLAFIVCRDSQTGLVKGRDLDAFREFYLSSGFVILKLPAITLANILSKLRNPEKYDAGSALLDKLLDVHIRVYASGQTETVRRRHR